MGGRVPIANPWRVGCDCRAVDAWGVEGMKADHASQVSHHTEEDPPPPPRLVGFP